MISAWFQRRESMYTANILAFFLIPKSIFVEKRRSHRCLVAGGMVSLYKQHRDTCHFKRPHPNDEIVSSKETLEERGQLLQIDIATR